MNATHKLPTIAPTIDDAGIVPIDVERLVLTRLLATANSGGGKGWLLRRLLEQTHGMAQHIVFDPEGEMHTLRESYDYVLVGAGGDAPAHLASAGLLARRLLELGVSAIIDLSDLPITKDSDHRAEYIKRFIESMMAAPRDLWHEVMVVVDEAQIFAPEKGVRDSVSTSAVIDLFTRGRKRGFCGIAVTQRLSELHKSVAAECNNRLIGRTTLDLDQVRAAKALGMPGKLSTFETLKNLDDGEFFAWGPALSGRQVTKVTIGETTTTHARAGTRGAPPTPPRARVRQVLAQFKDLPKEAEEEAKTADQLRARVRELEAQLKNSAITTLPAGAISAEAADELRRTNVFLLSELDTARTWARDWEKVIDAALEAASTDLDIIATRAIDARNEILNKLEDGVARCSATPPPPAPQPDPPKPPTPPTLHAPHGPKRHPSEGVFRMDRMFLTALVQFGRLGKRQILLYTGYRSTGDTSKAFARLVREGMVESPAPNELAVTAVGREALGEYEMLPVGRELRARVLERYNRLPRMILATVFDVYPNKIGKGEILERIGYRSTGDTSKAFAALTATGYILSAGPKCVVGAKELF